MSLRKTETALRFFSSHTMLVIARVLHTRQHASWAAHLGSSANPALAVTLASPAMCGQGFSGFTLHCTITKVSGCSPAAIWQMVRCQYHATEMKIE